MVQALCAYFPANFLGTDVYGGRHFCFPSSADLSSLAEATAWDLGWGYRAPRLVNLASQLGALGGDLYLASLARLDDGGARAALCGLCGVGRKV